MKDKQGIWFMLVVASILIFSSCDKDFTVQSDTSFGDDYVKLRVGTEWVYAIDSVYKETGLLNRTVHFFQKEVVVDSLKERNSITYYIDTYYSYDSLFGFTKSGRYTLVMYKDRLIRMGWDYNLIILTTPLEVGSQWNNLCNTCLYPYSGVSNNVNTYSHNDVMYEDMVDVTHCEHYRFDYSYVHKSTYVRDVGLLSETIFSKFRQVQTVTTKSLLTYAF
ncbi:MAG: hypothetical protein ACI9JN_001561 [Bacteroidia bacterium]